MSYFYDLKKGISSSVTGLKLTLKHIFAARKSRGNFGIKDKKYFELKEGHVTLQYPHQTIDVPETGRYQLDCEIDDCIVCDKCAKICPVDCIEIEAIKSPELIRTTSDGSPVRLHAAKFDIDLAKCCFCGLCTTVCPTECLTMNSEYDYSVSEVNLLNFAFSKLSAEEADTKRKLYEQFVAEKESQKANSAANEVTTPPASGGFKPKFQPKSAVMHESKPENEENKEIKKAFFPKPKPAASVTESIETHNTENKPFVPKGSAFKPVNKEITQSKIENIAEPGEKGFVPKFKPSIVSEEKNNSEPLAKPASKPIFKPKLKEVSGEPTNVPITQNNAGFVPKSNTENVVLEHTKTIERPAGKPVFKPKMGAAATKTSSDLSTHNEENLQKPESTQSEGSEKIEKPKFVPKLKPQE